MSDETPGFDTNILLRAVRLVVPWIVLGLVVLVVYSMLSEYQRNRDTEPADETTGTVETTEAVSPDGFDIPDGASYVIVLTDGLSLRAEAAPDGEVLKNLTVNQQLIVVDRAVGWYKVQDVSGAEGWVAAGDRYTKLVEQ